MTGAVALVTLVKLLVEAVMLALNTETVHWYSPACLVLNVTVTSVTGAVVFDGRYCPAVTSRESAATSTEMPSTWHET